MNRNREVLSPETRALLRSLHQGAELETQIRTILQQFAKIPPASIAAVSIQIRHDGELYAVPAGSFWFKLSKPQMSLRLLKQTPGLEFIYIFHGDGYLREAALNKITGGLQSPFLVAAVIWRMNDWAGPVRTAAFFCAQRVFPLTQPNIIARAALDLFPRQQGWERWGEPERSMIEEFYARPDITAELAKLLIEQTTGPSPSTLRHALRTPLLDAHLEDISIKSVNPVVRAIAVEALIDLTARWRSGFRWDWIDKRYNLKRWIPTYSHRELACSVSPIEVADRAIIDRSPLGRSNSIDLQPCARRRHLFCAANGGATAIANHQMDDGNQTRPSDGLSLTQTLRPAIREASKDDALVLDLIKPLLGIRIDPAPACWRHTGIGRRNRESFGTGFAVGALGDLDDNRGGRRRWFYLCKRQADCVVIAQATTDARRVRRDLQCQRGCSTPVDSQLELVCIGQ